MRAFDVARAPATPCCQWHTLAKDVLPFPCERPQQPGRSTCTQHTAELDLRVFQLANDSKLAWVVYWASGSRLMRRCDADEIARVLFERHPDGVLQLGEDRKAMELRVRGRLVALIRRLEWFK